MAGGAETPNIAALPAIARLVLPAKCTWSVLGSVHGSIFSQIKVFKYKQRLGVVTSTCDVTHPPSGSLDQKSRIQPPTDITQ
jgi:hypothetical protein